MAFFDTSFTSGAASFRQRVARLFETPFDRRYNQRTARVEALRALSDADLAARGIARQDIVLHVFAGKA